ncbi:MAG: PrsW family glutamic-type intramembrane protease [bacterium]|nr:PrsW family glutamic-type intramembrane protease [bacterium]
MWLLSLAIAPVGALFFFFYFKDRYEKEPKALLLRVFAMGALGVLPAVAIGIFLQKQVGGAFQFAPTVKLLVDNFLFIGLVEESIKYLVLFSLVISNSAFNEPYDGILYAVTASLGFATLENVLYVINGGWQIAIMRGMLAVPAHALFGVFMGYYLGLAKFTDSLKQKKKYFILALLIPTVLHGTYNSLLSTQQIGYVLMVLPLSYYMWVNALRRAKEQGDASPFKAVDS